MRGRLEHQFDGGLLILLAVSPVFGLACHAAKDDTCALLIVLCADITATVAAVAAGIVNFTQRRYQLLWFGQNEEFSTIIPTMPSSYPHQRRIYNGQISITLSRASPITPTPPFAVDQGLNGLPSPVPCWNRIRSRLDTWCDI